MSENRKPKSPPWAIAISHFAERHRGRRAADQLHGQLRRRNLLENGIHLLLTCPRSRDYGRLNSLQERHLQSAVCGIGVKRHIDGWCSAHGQRVGDNLTQDIASRSRVTL